MQTISRKQYLAFQGDAEERATMHQAYYEQFANAQVVSAVAGKFSPEELVQAYRADRHLNNIDLKEWDDLARFIYPWLDQELLKSTGQLWSLCTGVSACKAAAKVLIKRALGVPVA